MRFIFLGLIVILFSCGEDKHKKDTEENLYYSKYVKIYNSYDSLGVKKTLKELDEYIKEFPNMQDAYIFKAWILANNKQVDKIDQVFKEALKFDTTNIKIYQYWAALLMKDKNRIQEAKKINNKGFNIKSNDLELMNNEVWLMLFENKTEDAFKKSLKILEIDTLDSYKYYRTTAISSLKTQNDSLYNHYINLAYTNGLKDSLNINEFLNGKESIFKLYNTIK